MQISSSGKINLVPANDIRELIECTEPGSEFEILGPATKNARDSNTVLIRKALRVKSETVHELHATYVGIMQKGKLSHY